MPAKRFFTPSPLTKGSEISLSESEHHHARHVMRLRLQERIELVNGKGELAMASVSIAKASVTAALIEEVHHAQAPAASLVLAQAFALQNRLTAIVEKGTELGVTRFSLFPGSLSQKQSLSEAGLKRLRSVTISAMKQCGRLYLPVIELMPPLSKWEAPQEEALYGDPDPTAPWLLSAFRPSSCLQKLILFVGPESGFTEAEIAKLTAIGARGVRLSDQTLRTDTAAIAGVTLLTHLQLCQRAQSP